MNYPINVYLYGSEGNGWALDADLATTRQSLMQMPDLVQFTGLRRADVVYAVWEYPVLQMDPNRLQGKRIICQICNDLMRLHEEPSMIRAKELFGLWVPMTAESDADIRALGYHHRFIPYAVDTTIFTPRSDQEDAIGRLRRRYKIPEGVFVISSFMRDSSAGDLSAPKTQKGTTLLLEIGRQLVAEGLPVHFLLAGPRRHWIRGQMARHAIPYTFVGRKIDTDDNDINILTPGVINSLYHLSDLHLVTSRWEGGPRAVLECSATRTPILSTPVGLAPDILETGSLFSSVDDGVEKTRRHFQKKVLNGTIDAQYRKVVSRHVPGANVARFRALFEAIEKVPVFEPPPTWEPGPGPAGTLTRGVVKKIATFFRGRAPKKCLCISLWHEYHKPPYGGGNQFMMALRQAFKRLGVKVVVNAFSPSVDVHICNSAWFDKRIFQKRAGGGIRMIHRIDGPTTLYRGEGSDEDDRIFELNRQFASATVFQSAYSFKKSYDLGYRAVAPVVIHNSVDPGVFHAEDRAPFDPHRKVRLISCSWSDNPRKGGPFYKWLDANLDWDRFAYTFVGRVKERFKHIEHIPPQNSETLAGLLRDHDIFISASHHEPCSNALLESLACGMPVLYRNDGGNGELVSFGGLPFSGKDDVLGQLNRLVASYPAYQRLIDMRSIEEIAGRYIDLARKLMVWEHTPGIS